MKLTNRWVLGLAPSAMIATAVGSIVLTAIPPATAVAIEPGEYLCSGSGLDLVCVRHSGSSPSRPVVAVVGDSTARSLDAGIADLSQKYDWTYVAAAQNGCSIIDRVGLPGISNEPALGNARCPHDNASIRQRLLETYRPRLIIAMERFLLADYVGSSGERIVAGSPQHVQETEQGLESAAVALTSGGAELVFIETLPVEIPLACGDQAGAHGPDCSVRGSSDPITAQYNRVIDAVVTRHPGTMRAISLASVVCPNDHCVPKIVGIVLRYDRIHFTKAAAHWLAPRLYQELQQVGAVPIAIRQVQPPTASGRVPIEPARGPLF